MTLCSCGHCLGVGHKDGERRTCSTCGKAYEWVQEAGEGCYWVPAIKRFGPEDRPCGNRAYAIRRRTYAAQNLTPRARKAK